MSYQIKVTDETGQKETLLTAPGETTWENIAIQAVEQLHPFTDQHGDEPTIFHLHDDETGEALLPQQTVADVIRDVEAEFRARLAREMRAA